MKLHGDNVMLRPIGAEDFSKLVQWTLELEPDFNSEGDYPRSLEECESWLQRSQSNRSQERFAIVLNGNIIGDLELDHITWRSGDGELRIRIGEKDLWDKGYGTDAIKTLLGYAFGKLDLSRIYLKVYTDNNRAIRCYQKVGFKKEGKLTRRSKEEAFREIFLMRILKTEYLLRVSDLNHAG